MPDKAWKAFERRIAKTLDTDRTPLSGSADRPTHADVIHDDLYVECKYRKRMALQTWWEEAYEEAKKERKPLVLALHEKGKHVNLAVIDWGFFMGLWKCWKEAQSDGE